MLRLSEEVLQLFKLFVSQLNFGHWNYEMIPGFFGTRWTPCIFIVSTLVCYPVVALASTAASGLLDESGEAGVEVPEVVTVEVEETHPLPEVIIIIIIEPF